MIIIRDANGITVKYKDSLDSIRIGVMLTYVTGIDGERKILHTNHKPHNEYTIGELESLLCLHIKRP